MPLIRGIDARDARALPGVHAVLTLDDLAPVMTQRRMLRHSNSGTPLDRLWSFALADGEVSYVGETVAIVVADRPLRRRGRGRAGRGRLRRAARGRRLPQGRRRRARRRCAASSTATSSPPSRSTMATPKRPSPRPRTSSTRSSGSIAAAPIRSKAAAWSPNAAATDGSMTVWASTQKAHDLFQSLTALLGFDESRLRVATPDVGGGFGPKLCVYPEDIAVVAAAKLLRALDQMDRGPARAFHQRRPGARSVLVARHRGRRRRQASRRARPAHPRPRRLCAAGREHSLQFGLDDERALSCCRRCRWRSRSPPPTRRRCRRCAAPAIRRPPSRWSGCMDRVARELELGARRGAAAQSHPAREDALHQAAQGALRRQHAVRQRRLSGLPGASARGGAAGTTSRNARPRRARKAAISASGSRTASRAPAAGRSSRAWCGCRTPGGSRCSPAPPRSGRGLRTALAQICAGELGMRAQDITVVPGDTGGVSLGLGAFASRQTVTAGSSVLLAARAVAGKAKKLASHVLEAAEHDLEIVDGEVRVVGAPQLSVKLGELARILKGAPGYGFPPDIEPGLDANVNWRTDALAYANACHVAEVEVDIETGGVRDRQLRGAAGFRHADQSDDGRRPGARRRRARHRQCDARMDGLRREPASRSPPPSPTTCCRAPWRCRRSRRSTRRRRRRSIRSAPRARARSAPSRPRPR